jgi:hypothetical protein
MRDQSNGNETSLRIGPSFFGPNIWIPRGYPSLLLGHGWTCGPSTRVLVFGDYFSNRRGVVRLHSTSLIGVIICFVMASASLSTFDGWLPRFIDSWIVSLGNDILVFPRAGWPFTSWES